MLLSRVAEHLYWSARYLERAEDTARVIVQHTNLIVDLPAERGAPWEALLAVVGSMETYEETGRPLDEANIVAYLIDDPTNHSSVVASVAQARENLRITREVLPRAVWEAVNDLHLYVSQRHDEGVRRATRSRFLLHVVSESQRAVGALGGTMSRDAAYAMLRLGRHLERADMTTRILDVRAGTLMGSPRPYHEIQWTNVLLSLSAFQMFRRSVRAPISADAVIEFCVRDRAFPRAVAHCLEEVMAAVRILPTPEGIVDRCQAALRVLDSVDLTNLSAEDLRNLMDELQISIEAVHRAIEGAYFRTPV